MSAITPTKSFKNTYPFEQRKLESDRIRSKYPDRIPVICERHVSAAKTMQEIDKKKYLVPADLSVGQFMYVIRKRLKMDADKAMFLMINGGIPPGTELLSGLYKTNADKDGFLYLTYTTENTFGCGRRREL